MPVLRPVRASQRGPATQHAGPAPATESEQFDQDGFLVIRGALTPQEAGFYGDALDWVYAAAVADRRVPPGGALHQLSAVANCPQAAGLLDHRPPSGTCGRCWGGTSTSTTPTWTCTRC